MIISIFVKHIIRVDYFHLIIIRQHVHQTPPVPIVCHPAPVINMTGSVGQNLERDVRVFQEEHVQLGDADLQVAIREFVGNVEAERSEFSSLEQNAVEEAQGENKQFEFGCFGMVGLYKIRQVGHLIPVGSHHVRLYA